MLNKSLGLAVLMALAAPTTCLADITLTFFDLTDTVTWDVNNSGPLDCGSPNPEACTIFTTTVAGSFPGFALFFNIFEPDGTLSDKLSIVSNADGSMITTAFISDVDGVPLAPFAKGSKSIIEDGTIQTAATIALTGQFEGQDFIVRFQSDVGDVPEPATLALLGIGVAGLAASRRRRSS